MADLDATPLPTSGAAAGAAGDDDNNNPSNLDEEQLEEPACPTYFMEKQEILDIVQHVQQHLPKDHSVRVEDTELINRIARFEKVLGQYQELPQLLKPHLEDFCIPLIALFAERLPAHIANNERESGDQKKPQQSSTVTSTTPSSSTAAAAAAAPTSCTNNNDIVGSNNNTEDTTTLALTVENKLGQEFEAYELDATRTAWHIAARLVCYVCKVVGFKSVIGYFPHDVKMLEPCFQVLQAWMRDPATRPEWEVRYGLLLWLSNLILVPFALNNIDSSAATGSLSTALLECALTFLGDASKCREGAALFIGRLLTRPDAEKHRARLMQEAIVEMSALASTGVSSHVRAGGVLHAAAIAFKTGCREELVGFARMLIPIVSPVTLLSGDARVCKTATKLLQRLGLALLPNRPQPWRYNKARTAFLGKQDLGATVAQQQQQQSGDQDHDNDNKKKDDDDDNDAASAISLEHLEQVEEVVDILIRALGHTDTMVRYSAAKGIGRISERLPRDCADDIVNAIMDPDSGPFALRENDANWHGATLALAEICRRYALLPSRFSQLVPLVEKALTYDVCKGSYSVGSHVRDAASYICWAAARSYNLDDLADYVTPLSRALVTTALTDREVNVRRAASAAFQECAGRLGNFPHALDIITTVDFFALANLRHALLDVAPRISWIPEYRTALFDRLLNDRIEHWSKEVREISAAALGILANRMDDKYIVGTVVPRLCKQALESMSVSVRHGSVAALAEIVGRFDEHTFSDTRVMVAPVEGGGEATKTKTKTQQQGQAQNPSKKKDQHVCKDLGAKLMSLIPHLEAKRLFRGRGAEYLRQVCCKLIENISLAKLSLPDKLTRPGLRGSEEVSMRMTVQTFLEETCKNLLRWLQRDGSNAMKAFGDAYYPKYNPAFHGALLTRLVQGTAPTKTPNERRGSCLMLGALPASVLCAVVTVPAAAKKEEEEEQPAPSAAKKNQEEVATVFDTAVDKLCSACVASSSSSSATAPAPATAPNAMKLPPGVKLPASVLAVGAGAQSTKQAEGEDAECREEAVRALGRCCVTVVHSSSASTTSTNSSSSSDDAADRRPAAEIISKNLPKIETAFEAAFEDYATDRRGDIGLFVRLAALESYRGVLEAVLLLASPSSSSSSSSSCSSPAAFGILAHGHLVNFVCACLKQTMEKIDRVRTVASKQLQQFVENALVAATTTTNNNNNNNNNDSSSEADGDQIVTTLLHPVVSEMINSDAERRILEERRDEQRQRQSTTTATTLIADLNKLAQTYHAVPATFDWGVPSAAFDVVVPNLTACPTFCASIVDGLAASAGCLTPHVANSALDAMVRATSSSTSSTSAAASSGIAAAIKEVLFPKYRNSERMTVPTLLMAERALERAVVSDADLLAAAIDQCFDAQKVFAKDVQRTLALVPVMSGLARRCIQYFPQLDRSRVKAWQSILTLLGNRFPKVRALCSVEMFTILSALPDDDQRFAGIFAAADRRSNSSGGGGGGGNDDADDRNDDNKMKDAAAVNSSNTTITVMSVRDRINKGQQLLTETPWDTVAASEVKGGARQSVFDVLCVPMLAPDVVTVFEAAATGAGKAKKPVSELAMYKTLVQEKGF